MRKADKVRLPMAKLLARINGNDLIYLIAYGLVEWAKHKF